MVTIHRLKKNGHCLKEINRLLPQLSASGNYTLLDRKRLKQRWLNPDFHIFVVSDKTHQNPEKLIGLCTIFFQWNLGHCISEIHDVVVDKPHRGRGFGDLMTARLKKEARTFAKRHKTDLKLYLTSRSKRRVANRMYHKHGFVLVAKAVGKWGTNLYKIAITAHGTIKKPAPSKN